MTRTGIIGGGLGGLAAACTLAARGHDVVLFEKNDWLGGKAAVLEEEGFRFDMGPTILTMPRVLERIFSEAGRDLHEALDLRRLDPQWRCFYDDGSVLDLRDDPKQAAAEIGKLSPADREGFEKFMGVARRLSDVSDKFFFWKSVEDLRDTMDLKGSMNLSTLSDVMALRMHRTVAGQIKRDVKDKRVAQMLEHFIQYVGSSPLASPAVLCGIAQMQQGEGVWYPMGGTRAVPRALTALAESLGVEIRTGVGVSRIEIEGGRARAIITDTGERVACDRVVSNMDSVRTYAELVGGAEGRASRRPASARRPVRGWCSIWVSTGPTSIWRITTSSFRATPRKNSARSMTVASPPPIRPPMSRPRRAPSRGWRPRAARRSTCWCTRPICVRITTGRRCCRATAR
ncbi:phytoene desaturase family protein [Limimaricola cinnabarinus]|uniref:Phytoene desaturase, neurosporene or lycopene producing / 4,4'-diapolycopene oxidase n=1 Tax=Limimaricola cinnabarinus LL-001 TaxID=1337093 RepID=U2Z8Z8_9RHOB|nr:phytoene desaturase family protein [Limimaricola cinnabarinus]GAD57537.1 phytoene desaturase, neurosporene or lycopene producing / 4,4'-diapolycopene oxidase [Limimaricola cinnabarinus LL-001]